MDQLCYYHMISATSVQNVPKSLAVGKLTTLPQTPWLTGEGACPLSMQTPPALASSVHRLCSQGASGASTVISAQGLHNPKSGAD